VRLRSRRLGLGERCQELGHIALVTDGVGGRARGRRIRRVEDAAGAGREEGKLSEERVPIGTESQVVVDEGDGERMAGEGLTRAGQVKGAHDAVSMRLEERAHGLMDERLVVDQEEREALM
jgi:hypothetical protein